MTLCTIDNKSIELWAGEGHFISCCFSLCRYYKEKEDITKDYELQEFTNEMSIDGKNEDGGLGMVRLCNHAWTLVVTVWACVVLGMMMIHDDDAT